MRYSSTTVHFLGTAAGNATAILTDGGNHTECGNGWCIVADPRKRPAAQVASNGTAAPISRAAPLVPITEPATSQQPDNVSHPFFVVEDRQAQFLPPEILARRKEPAQLIATNAPVQEPKSSKEQSQLPVISQSVPREEPRRYPPPALPEDGKTYLLPHFSGENVIVTLPEPHEISQFQWFGLYDHCRRVRTAFVNVRGIQAPKEVRLNGLKGWQYDVSSGDIYVKNCNTLQITNFTFSGAGKTDAYIYVGNGAFPHSIIQKGRAYIDGSFPDRSLKNFNNDNILVKLPTGWKTFDITWISVFNPRGNVSYGHVIVPPLVVPTCEDPK